MWSLKGLLEGICAGNEVHTGMSSEDKQDLFEIAEVGSRASSRRNGLAKGLRAGQPMRVLEGYKEAQDCVPEV